MTYHRRDEHDYREMILRLLDGARQGLRFRDLTDAVHWNTYTMRSTLNKLVSEGLVERVQVINSAGHRAVRFRNVKED